MDLMIDERQAMNTSARPEEHRPLAAVFWRTLRKSAYCHFF